VARKRVVETLKFAQDSSEVMQAASSSSSRLHRRVKVLRLAVLLGCLMLGAVTAWVASHKHWPGEKDFSNGIGLEMVWCEPGAFQMGSAETEPSRYKKETLHLVTLSRGFWIGRYEVSQGEWKRVMGSTPSFYSKRRLLWIFEGSNHRHPVETVSRDEALEFCKHLTRKERSAGRLEEGWIYTLPTESQWEYTCRAGASTAYAFGEELSHQQANFASKKGTVRCGSYRPAAWGIYDMHGNVAEWCLDGYGDYPRWSVRDPTGPEKVAFRVVRGGSWSRSANDCRSAFRFFNESYSRNRFTGFRPVLIRQSASERD